MLFGSTDNKRMIWSLLLDASYFKGFQASHKDMVKRVLDSVVGEMDNNPRLADVSLQDKNREVVKQMMMYRDLWVQDGTVGSERTANQQPMHQTQYQQLQQQQVTAEDIREERDRAFQASLRSKQAEMESLLNGSRPDNIDFSDKTKEERIGGDMERLVAEAQAERQREMEQALRYGQSGRSQAEVEKWINGGRPLQIEQDSNVKLDIQTIATKPSGIVKAVRFEDDFVKSETSSSHQIEQTNDIFSRLKRKQGGIREQEQGNYEERLRKIEDQVSNMSKNIETILSILSKQS